MSINQKRLAMRKRAALNAYQYGVQGGIPKRKLFKTKAIKKPNYSKVQGNNATEMKSADLGPAALAYSTTGTITLLNGVAQGLDNGQRIGRKFNVRSILVRGFASVGSTPTASCIRHMLVYDKQTNGVLPVITDILNTVSMLGCNNLDNRDRFVILADKTSYLEAAGRSQIPIKMFLKTNLEVINSGVASTIASINTGSLYLITIGQLAAGVTAPTLSVLIRVRFQDD